MDIEASCCNVWTQQILNFLLFYKTTIIFIQTLVLVNFFALSCDPAHFPEPLTFNPDRWKKDKANVVHPFGALPFGIGPRMCLGQ